MRRNVVGAVVLLLTLLAGGPAMAQASAFRLPWDVPSAEAAGHLRAAGFSRAADEARFVEVPGGGFRRAAPDTTRSTYVRKGAGVTESVFLVTRNGQTVQMSYSAIGDSTALQARADEAGADITRKLGSHTRRGILRFWQSGDGQRLTAPARPSRLPDTRYQLLILYHRS